MVSVDEIEGFSALTDEIMAFSSLGIRPGLGRMSRLLSSLDMPQRSFRAIHVLGTNGKGSTVAAMDAVCRAAGLRTATYTSPHLVSLQERVSVNGVPLPIGVWRDALERTRAAVEGDVVLRGQRPTFFENLTALAFLMIRDAGVDIGVLEAGMGGRYDASMLCNALATVVTPIGMDHMEYLGDTLSAIATEKFSAVRPGIPAFYAADDAALRAQFLAACRSNGAIPFCSSELASAEEIDLTLDGTTFTYAGRSGGRSTFYTPLIGFHQAQNAANVVTVFKILRERCDVLRGVGDGEIQSGLAASRWPGRVEILPNGGGPTVILDGAHNEHGLRALLRTLSALAANGAMRAVRAVVFAVMRDKELSPLLALLRGLNCPVYCTHVPMKRALSPDELEADVLRCGLESGGAYDDPLEALGTAESRVGRAGTVVCCGSLFLVGSIKKGLGFYD